MTFNAPAATGFILLHVPWGLIALSDAREDINGTDAQVDTARSIAPLIFSYDDVDIFFSARTSGLEKFADLRTRLHEPQVLWELPVPLKISETQTLRHEQWNNDVPLRWRHAVDRPIHRNDAALGSLEPGWPWHRFLMELVGRMQDFEAALSDAQDPWEFVLFRWLDTKKLRDPTMDILVRHAKIYRERWNEIAQHPRRLLNRQREMVALSRVQELDTQCMQWLSRQPGNTLVERAGGRQRIMALARYENRNTLENRVFLDLLLRSRQGSREYLEQNRNRNHGPTSRRSARYNVIHQYERLCQRLAVELAGQGVTRALEVDQPNYVLLYDTRYQDVWTAWQDIIRRERVMDDLWRWQRRSWTEFCKASVVMALLAQPGTHMVAASPIFFRQEHHRGEWLLHDDPLAVIAHEQRGWVIEILNGNSSDVLSKMKELGAAFWLRYSDFAGGTYRYLPVWTIHAFDRDCSLGDLVASANNAFRYLRDKSVLTGGLILLSSLDEGDVPSFLSAEKVTGFSFGPWDSQLAEALDQIGGKVSALIEGAI